MKITYYIFIDILIYGLMVCVYIIWSLHDNGCEIEGSIVKKGLLTFLFIFIMTLYRIFMQKKSAS